MANVIVVGTQWGDEGKGKVVDILSQWFDAVARYQGGNNAGHTVVVGEEKIVLHLVPSGVLRRGKICVLGNGVVIDLEALIHEMDQLERLQVRLEGTRGPTWCSPTTRSWMRRGSRRRAPPSGPPGAASAPPTWIRWRAWASAWRPWTIPPSSASG
jgi:hypothetical protein